MKPIHHAIVALALALGGTAPARADVKDGVDAWTRGDYAAAVAQWQGPAGAGDPDALFNLAQAYRLGRGVAPDPARARDYYEQAAANGHVRAADNLGLMLFQEGQYDRAMPYIRTAAGRGDPRAQYVLGLAHFNGNIAERDWIRGYALMTLANAAGLPQAATALQQMDRHVPLGDRQQAQALAADLQREADGRRAVELAAVDLVRSPGLTVEPTSRLPRPVDSASLPPSNAAGMTRLATAEAARVEPKAPTPAAAAPVPSDEGPWRVQLGAFGVRGNAERLWTQLARREVLAGKRAFYVPGKTLTRLLAGGFASQAEAQAACNALKRDRQPCLVTR